LPRRCQGADVCAGVDEQARPGRPGETDPRSRRVRLRASLRAILGNAGPIAPFLGGAKRKKNYGPEASGARGTEKIGLQGVKAHAAEYGEVAHRNAKVPDQYPCGGPPGARWAGNAIRGGASVSSGTWVAGPASHLPGHGKCLNLLAWSRHGAGSLRTTLAQLSRVARIGGNTSRSMPLPLGSGWRERTLPAPAIWFPPVSGSKLCPLLKAGSHPLSGGAPLQYLHRMELRGDRSRRF